MDDDTTDAVGEVSRGDRPFATGDLPGRPEVHGSDLAADLQARIAALDAIAWNLPSPRSATGREERDPGDD